MNRAQRRAAARSRPDRARSTAIALAVNALGLAAGADQTISGATVMLASGETVYLDAATARTMRTAAGAGSGDRH